MWQPQNLVSALEDLRHAGLDGGYAISRAVMALEIAVQHTGSDESEDSPNTWAAIDRATAEVRELLDDAMRSIYKAASVIDGVS